MKQPKNEIRTQTDEDIGEWYADVLSTVDGGFYGGGFESVGIGIGRTRLSALTAARRHISALGRQLDRMIEKEKKGAGR